MNDREKALRDRLWRVFQGEAQEHIDALSRHLLDLEDAPAADVAAALVETAFREAHSLKGAARAVNVASIESVCQAMETILARLKQREVAPTHELIDALLDATRLTQQLLQAEENKTPSPSIHATIDALKKASWVKNPPPPKTSVAASPAEEATKAPAPAPAVPAVPPVPPAAPAAPEVQPATPVPPAATDTPIHTDAPASAATPSTPVPAPAPMPAPAPASMPAPAASPVAAPASKPESVSAQATALPSTAVGPAPVPPPGQPVVRDVAAPTETVRVSTAMLDTVRVQAEELLADKLAAVQRATELRELSATLAEWTRRWTTVMADFHALPAPSTEHVPTPAAQAFERIHAFLEWNREFLPALETRLNHTTRAAGNDRQALGAKIDILLAGTRDLLMLPFSWLIDAIRQPVRDLAREQGKEVHLLVEGDAVELDRRVLAELKAPFLHLLRNSLDHGIEPPAERQAAGKPRVATLAVRIAPARNGRVEISVGDDGRGVDLDRLRRALLESGGLESDRVSALADAELLQCVFNSGISTSPSITDLSGRGLGLAIVREKAEKLGGAVRIESTPGKGATLRLSLPLSFATFRGVVARVGDYPLVFPVESVVRVTRVAAKQITTLENREVITEAGEQLSLVRIAAPLGLSPSPQASTNDGPSPVLIVASGGLRLAFLVDEICGEQEIVAKKLGPQGARLPHIAGATVLGTGQPALILDTQELIRLAVRQSESGATRGAATGTGTEADAGRKKSILVADDSITSRTLLRSILESAGFVVETAVDGVDAFAKLRSAPVDLVVSDVDMPRLHGVGLTEKMRADSKLSAIPVILITSLDSREDRERGLEAGANAYIAKRNFEESNLLDTVHRLI